MLIALEQNCSLASMTTQVVQPYSMTTEQEQSQAHHRRNAPCFDVAIQKILDATDYGSHPRLRKLESPITRALNAENELLHRTRSGISKGSQLSRIHPRSELYTDLPKRLPPKLKRMNGERLASRSAESLHQRYKFPSRKTDDAITISETSQCADQDSPRASITTTQSRRRTLPLSAATRHAQVMQRRSLLARQGKQEVSTPENIALTQLPLPSSFMRAQDLRAACDTSIVERESSSPVVSNLDSPSDTLSFVRRPGLRPFNSNFLEDISDASSSFMSIESSNHEKRESEHQNRARKQHVGQHASRSRTCKFVFGKWC